MVHSGYESSAVNHTFASLGGLIATVKAMVFNTYPNVEAKRRLAEEAAKPHGPVAQLVQLGLAADVVEKDGKRTVKLVEQTAA
jgi:hypothetical protein